MYSHTQASGWKRGDIIPFQKSLKVKSSSADIELADETGYQQRRRMRSEEREAGTANKVYSNGAMYFINKLHPSCTIIRRATCSQQKRLLLLTLLLDKTCAIKTTLRQRDRDEYGG
jgi:hypothetical protein